LAFHIPLSREIMSWAPFSNYDIKSKIRLLSVDVYLREEHFHRSNPI